MRINQACAARRQQDGHARRYIEVPASSKQALPRASIRERAKPEGGHGKYVVRECPFECDDVTKRGGRQQKTIAAGYRTREDTDGLLRPPLLGGTKQPIHVLEQILVQERVLLFTYQSEYEQRLSVGVLCTRRPMCIC